MKTIEIDRKLIVSGGCATASQTEALIGYELALQRATVLSPLTFCAEGWGAFLNEISRR